MTSSDKRRDSVGGDPTDVIAPFGASMIEETRLRDILKQHYLYEIHCNHETKTDNPRCACSLVYLGDHPTMGDAAAAWVDHVLEMMKNG